MKRNHISRFGTRLATVVLSMVTMLLIVSLASCDAMHEDLAPCPQGLRLRFMSTWNLEEANMFPSQVDCLTVFVFDSEGNRVVDPIVRFAPEISDEEWRLDIPLPEGTYTVLAYGGMACDNASFRFDFKNVVTKLEDMEVFMRPGVIDAPAPDNFLHPLYYGRLVVDVPAMGPDSSYTPATVDLMKDTNNIRVMMSNSNGVEIDYRDFDWVITDNNTRFNWLNDIISTETVIYKPWASGNSTMGTNVAGNPFSVSYAEFSTSRLMRRSDAKLIITRKSDGVEVVNVDLINVLQEMRSQYFSYLSPQDFLDRESWWELSFFLAENGRWAYVEIRVMDYVVRKNYIKF